MDFRPLFIALTLRRLDTVLNVDKQRNAALLSGGFRRLCPSARYPFPYGFLWKFELGAAVQAYIRFLGRDAMTEEDKKLESAKRKAEATLKLSKAKIAKAQADELSGQMHRSEDVAAMTADLIYTIRGALMAFPGRVAIDAAAITDAAEEAEYLRKEVNILCAQLAQYRYDQKAYEARVRERMSWGERDHEDDDE